MDKTNLLKHLLSIVNDALTNKLVKKEDYAQSLEDAVKEEATTDQVKSALHNVVRLAVNATSATTPFTGLVVLALDYAIDHYTDEMLTAMQDLYAQHFHPATSTQTK